MRIFIRSQISSLIATLLDFMVTVACVEWLHLYYLLAGVMGAIAGALCNFLINKFWSFNVGRPNMRKQGARYLLVWLGSIGLNILGLYFFTRFIGFDYVVSKVVSAIIVGLCFNFILQKKFVFKTQREVFN